MLREHRRALALCGLSLVDYALLYVTSILLARTLSIPDFDDYNVAISTVLVLTAIATLGLEKYALRVLPELQHDRDWSRSRAFLRSSRGQIFLCSLALVAFLGVSIEGTLILRGRDHHLAILVAATFLPVIALFHFDLEVVSSYGGELKAVAVYRVLFPAALLVLNTVVWLSPLASSGVLAASCYGLSWVASLAVIRRLTRRQVPDAVWRASPARQPRSWVRGAAPFLFSSIILTMLAQTGVVILELLHPNEAVVSTYAVALQTGTFVVVLATATNRLFAPRIAELLARGDIRGLRRAARSRRRLIGPLTGVYLLGIVFFGRSILAVFGKEFITVYPALCVVATGASISTLFSLAPTYLQFTDRSRLAVGAMAASLGLNLALCVPLCQRLGALGAAVAYAVPISALYIGLAVYAATDLRLRDDRPGIE